jgi:hypothetical protein
VSTLTLSASPTRRAAGAGARSRHSAIRLTRRGRLVLTLALAVLLLALVSVGRSSLGASSTPGPTPTYERIVVHPGQTLWEVARAAHPGTDPRITIARILEINGMDQPSLRAGQVLLVPTNDGGRL